MDDAPGSGDQAAPPTLPLGLWRLTRLSLDYLLDAIEISRGGRDLVDRLLLAAIIDANIGAIRTDPELQVAYGGLDAPPPDGLARPVSVNAIAESLRLPFETVRRRIAQLTLEGACVTTPAGVLVPAAALATPEFRAMSLARYARVQRFYFDLRAAEALPDLGGAGEPPGLVDDPPVRLVNRLLAEHLMRFIDGMMQRTGDPLTGLVLLEMVRANTEHLTAAETEAEIPIPDRLRRPVSVIDLAQRLHTPPETVRRRAGLLERRGFCRRSQGGLTVLAGGLARPGVVSLIGENAANVQRLFSRLARYGVLAGWERAAAPPEAAAAAPESRFPVGGRTPILERREAERTAP